MFNNPGAAFMGTFNAVEQKFLKEFLTKAKAAGYKRVVEPYAGAFAMSHLAVQAGFRPNQIEASDVALMTSILGYAIMGKPLNDLGIKAEGFTDEELLDPAVAIYAQIYLRSVKGASNAYSHNIMRDMKRRREQHISNIREHIDRAKETLHGLKYEPRDSSQHLEEIFDDPETVVIANPPTYKAGYEKYYNTGGRMVWNEPEYEIFDPETGLPDLYEKFADAKCLLLLYEEKAPETTLGYPLFARNEIREGINAYFTTNQQERAEEILKGNKIARKTGGQIEPLNCAILPSDYVITEKTKVEVLQIEKRNAEYYRKLWTHNFIGSACSINCAMLVDGYIAGVFGYNKDSITIGFKGQRTSDAIFLMYGVTIPHTEYRLGRLMTMMAQNRKNVNAVCSIIEREKAHKIKTIQMTKYPESKENRGIMKLIDRKQDPKHGYRLTYIADIKDRTDKETLIEWLRREMQWRKERARAKQSTN